MTAVDVDDQNFRCWLPRIAESIEGAAFVSFDLEFLGLPSALKNHSASLFDSPSDRYRKVRDAVRRFPPCQLGLVCFQEDGDAARYRPDVYCITLFKRVPQREFSVSPSAVCFLSKHDFDFNKGVNYCTKTEAAKLRSEVSFGEFDFRQLREDFADLVRSVRIQIAAESEGDVGVSQLLDGPFQLKGPVEVELFRSQDNAEGDTVPRCLSPLEEAALHYVLQEEFPDLEFRTDPSRTLLCVENRQPVLDNDSILPTQQKLEMLIAEISGVSRIFDLLSAQKVPIVAHNCLLDLMYIYNYFDDDLPENYPLWKEKFHERFPAVIDSKFFAETLGEILCPSGVHGFSLRALCNFFNSKVSSDLVPLSMPVLPSGLEYDRSFEGRARYHNAAFDALVTGEVFLRLAYLYAMKRCSPPLEKPWPFRRLFVAFRGEVMNRISIGIIDSKCCNMEGPDGVGYRPDTVEIRRRHPAKSFSSSFSISSFIRDIAEGVVGQPEISPEELYLIRGKLVRVFGAYRIDVRFGAQRRSLEIATNSPFTYAHVCSFFDNSEEYELVDGRHQTFEQRLCCSRVVKSATERTSTHTTTMITVIALLSLAVSSLTWTASRLTRS